MQNKHFRHHELEFVALAVILIALWSLGKYFHFDVQSIQSLLKEVPLALSGFLYIIFYVVISFFIFFSKDVFWLTGAIMFGPFISTMLICIAEVINAFILFYLARTLGRNYVEKKLPEKYQHLDEKIGNIKFFWLFVFRAAPLIPYRFLDLAAGLTRIRFKKYITAVILGSPVKMFWIQYILYGVGHSVFNNPRALMEYFLDNRQLMLFSLIYVVMVIAVIYKLNFCKNHVNKS